MATSRALSLAIELSGRCLALKTHLLLIIFLFTRRGTNRQVFIPIREEYSSSTALSHLDLFGDLSS